MTVVDSDDFGPGERAELGYNSWTWAGKTFFLYKEGERRVTSFQIRLPTDFPDEAPWQVVMQMKQTAPSNGSGGSPILALECLQGEWRVNSAAIGGSLWTTPLVEKGMWVPVSFDVVYSKGPATGSIQVRIGDASSPRIAAQTLKPEEAPGDKGIDVGEAIPSHLRLGIYHDPGVRGTSVDLAAVRVLG